MAAGILPAVEPGFQPGGESVRRDESPQEVVSGCWVVRIVTSGRLEAALYVRQDA